MIAAGVGAGLLAEKRAVRARRTVPDPVAREPFFGLPFDRTGVVIADDGVELRYEEVGREDASMTVIFAHGFTLQMAAWHFQRRALGDVGRLVFYDQRSHGRSGASAADRCTIDQLGSDLERVIDDRAPTGPIVLVGHSMGGMTVMALADRRPDLFGPDGRVAGVALVSTSAGGLAELTFGLPALGGKLAQRLVPKLIVGIGGKRARFIDAQRRRGLGNDLGWSLARRVSFGDPEVSPSLVDFMEQLIAATPAEVVATFAPTFLDHDKLKALPALRGRPVLVIVGDHDVLTPAAHSRAMAEEIGSDAELVVMPGAGHMAKLERPAVVTLHLRALVARARDAVAQAA
ncbi:MAG TPA: alpha/beta hydrolase [Mycobacteriales bacterium]|nr:alpha/beta hydrolase [Mycobacteriales bacterium]